MPITIEQRKINEKWILQMKSLTKNMWFWKDNGNAYDMSGRKIVPQTLKGYVELAGIVRKEFMKAFVELPRDGDYNEGKIWRIIDEITATN